VSRGLGFGALWTLWPPAGRSRAWATAWAAAGSRWRLEALIVSGLVLLALGLRGALLTARSLTFEETFSVHVARLPWGLAWRTVASIDSHPPLYYLLLKLWIWFGSSPIAVRSFSAFLGGLAVVPTWLLARRVGGRPVAVGAAALVATSAMAIQASIEARMYAQMMFLAVWATYFLLRASANGRYEWWVAYGLAIAAALYTHYFAFFVVLAHGAYVFTDRRAEWSVRRGYLIAVAGAFVVYAPWVPAVGQQMAVILRPDVVRETWGRIQPEVALNILALPSIGGYFLGLGGYYVSPPWQWPQMALVLPFAALAVVGGLARSHSDTRRLILFCWFVPVSVLMAGSLVVAAHYARPRTTSFLEPFFAILLVLGLAAWLRRKSRPDVGLAVAVGFLMALNLAALGLSLSDSRYRPFDWAGAGRYVEQRWRPDDRAVLYPFPARIAFGYYFPQALPNAVTVLAPSPGSTLTAAQLRDSMPPVVRSLGSAQRIWFVVTLPVPPGTVELLLESVQSTYERREAAAFGGIWVFLFEKRTGDRS